jgi:hypothetical protein
VRSVRAVFVAFIAVLVIGVGMSIAAGLLHR